MDLTTQRKLKIIESVKQGLTYREIGKLYNISRQRVHQIATGYKSPASYIPYWKKIGLATEEQWLQLQKEKLKKRAILIQTQQAILERKKLKEIERENGIRADLHGIDNKKFQGRDLVREAIRKRDNYTCQICGKKWKRGKRRLDIHHLDGLCGKKSQAYDKAGDITGLITLCHKCHLNLDENRKKMSIANRKNYPLDN